MHAALDYRFLDHLDHLHHHICRCWDLTGLNLSSFMPFVIASSILPALLVITCGASCMARLMISIGKGQEETKR